MMKKTLILLLALLPMPLFAGEGDDDKPKKARRDMSAEILNRLDKDGDGKISAAEWPQQARQPFAKVDANGDGFVDAAELRAGMRRGRGGDRQRNEGKNRGADREQVRRIVDANLKRMDKNGDGKISADELPEQARASFMKMDTGADVEARRGQGEASGS
jgi:Ca2+-binding EF-hand superfamily protein